MRIEYVLTGDQLNRLLDASKPVPYMVMGGMQPLSPQENANRVWKSIAAEMGFVWDTVEPMRGKGDKYFSAVKAVGVPNANGS